MNRILMLAALALPLCAALPAAAHAEPIYYAIDGPTKTANPGDTVSFNAEIAEIEGDYFFLNGDSFSVQGPLSIDDTGLFFNFDQLFFDYQDEDQVLFTVTLSPHTPTGTYLGTFALYGGTDSGSNDLLGSQNFAISTVNTSISGVPEPPALLLLGSALLAMGALLHRRRRTL